MIPGLGEFADLFNGAISLLRGDLAAAAASFAAMVPFIGTIATTAKIADKGTDAAKAANIGAEATSAAKRNPETHPAAGAADEAQGVPTGELGSSRKRTMHGAERMAERGFSDAIVESIIKNNKKSRTSKIGPDGRKTWEYKNMRGNTIVTNEDGAVITAYSPAEGGNYIGKPPRRK